MTGQQSPPPCPPWCTDLDGRSLGHWHTSGLIGSTAYMKIVQRPGEAPVIRLSSWDADAPIIDATAADARMLASLMRKPEAAALRKAADLLDEITSGGAS